MKLTTSFVSGTIASLLAVCAVVGPVTTTALAQSNIPVETKAQRDKRMGWWREARFGMFVHWGLYAIPAGQWNGKPVDIAGEWIMNGGKIPVSDYAALAPQFNPTRFDADAWAKVAKQAGMKYLVITAKHHEGFALFPSKASAFNIMDATPFHRDPLQELATACRKQGIKFGLYYSQAQDWHHPGGAAYGGHWDKAQDGDLHEYVQKVAAPQVREIVTRYHPAVLWWDTPVEMSPEDIAALTAAFPENPGMIANNRLGNGVAGDTETPEQFIPSTGFPNRDWETCMTMNNTWGYRSDDNNWKSAPTLIRNLIDIASKGGNYLLNVGPTAQGEIPEASIERLQVVGEWMKTNRTAIYGTSASPFKRLSWGRATRKGDTLYLHVFDWPKDGKLTVPMTGAVRRATLLTDRKHSLPTTVSAAGVTIAVPAAAPDPVASVVALEIGKDFAPIVFVPEQAQDGSIALLAENADIVGSTARIEGGEKANIGYWTNADDSLRWTMKVTRPGTFRVEMEYSAEPGSEGSEFVVATGESSLTGTVAVTKGWSDYRTVPLGTLRVEKPGTVVFTLKATKKPGLAVMNLRSLRLAPE